MADLDIAENFRARADQYAVADFGMAVLVLLAGATKRDAVQDRDVVFDHSGLADDEAGGVIKEDTPADPGCGVDVGLEYRRRAALQIIRKILAAFSIEPMRQTTSLRRMEALEVEQRVDETRGRGIAVIYRHHVGAEGVAEIGLVAQRLVIGLANQIARQRRMIEPLGEAMHHRVLQTFVMQHGRIDKGRQLRLAANDIFRLVAHAIPDRIERRQFRSLRIDLMHSHVLLSQVLVFSSGIIARRADGCPAPLAKGEPRLWLRMRAKTLKRHIFSHRPKSSLAESVGSRWSGIPGNQAVQPPTICGFPRRDQSGHGGRKTGDAVSIRRFQAAAERTGPGS